jgi:hypothetical protein
MVIVSRHGAQLAFVGIFCGFARARLERSGGNGVAARGARQARGLKPASRSWVLAARTMEAN